MAGNANMQSLPATAQTMTQICREAESAILHTVLFDELRQEIKTVAPSDMSGTTGAHAFLIPRVWPVECSIHETWPVECSCRVQ